MREIRSDSADLHVRALVCGLPSSGKTHFAATAPKPLFISDNAEGGFKTIFRMDRTMWWDPKQDPEVWALESMTDIAPALIKLEAMAQGGKFPWRTIVFDPLSIYTDRVLSELEAKKPGGDKRQLYGDLGTHLRALVLRVHALPAHILWLCHVKNDGSEQNGPAIGGQMGVKLPAYMDFKWLCNVTTDPKAPPTFEMRTRPFRSWTFLGGRAANVPDPMIPSFKCAAEILGLPDRPVSPSVPGYPEGVSYKEASSQQQTGSTAAA